MEDMYSDIYEKLSRLQWLLQRHQMVSHAEHGPFADVNRGQGRVLALLKIQPEISTKDLAYLLGIRQQSLNELLSKLEKGGYVERRPSEADKRIMIVHLTAKGESVDQPENDYQSIFSCLSDEELSAFGEYLDRVIAALESKVGNPHDETYAWMNEARGRMGNEQFDRLMRHSGHGHDHDRRCCGHNTGGWHDAGPNGFGHGGFGPDSRGPAPSGMPGAERFAPDYDGPEPRGYGSKENEAAEGVKLQDDEQ